MPLCLDSAGGQITVFASQPVEISACSYVVFTGAEAIQVQASPLNLSESDALSIGGAMLLVWASAWGLKQVLKLISNLDQSGE